MLRISAQLIKDEFDARGIPCEVISEESSILRYQTDDGDWHITRSSLSEKSSGAAVVICQNKLATDDVATKCGLPVLPTYYGDDRAEIEAFINQHGSVVVKPLDASHGHGVTINVTNMAKYDQAAAHALQFSDTIFLQKQAKGSDYRILIINYELAAATRRDHASVVGDGQHTLAELIEIENNSGNRIEEYGTKPNKIDVAAAQFFLEDRYTQEVPAKDQRVQVVGVANIGAGGTATDVTDSVAPAMVKDAIAVLQYLRLPTAGVDFMQDPNSEGYSFIEINPSPNFSMHTSPHFGSAQPVAQRYVDWLLQN